MLMYTQLLTMVLFSGATQLTQIKYLFFRNVLYAACSNFSILSTVENILNCMTFCLYPVYIYLNVCLLLNVIIQNFFYKETKNPYDTRNKGKYISLPKTRLKLVDKGPYCKCITIFNNLREHIKIISNVLVFRKEVKKFLLQHCFYSVQEYFQCKWFDVSHPLTYALLYII